MTCPQVSSILFSFEYDTKEEESSKRGKKWLKKKKSKPVWFHVSGSPGQNSPKLWRQKGGELYQKSAAGFWRCSLRWNLRLALLSQEERIFFPSQFVWMELFKKKKILLHETLEVRAAFSFFLSFYLHRSRESRTRKKLNSFHF